MRYRNLFALVCACALALGCGSSKPKTDPTGGGGGDGSGTTDKGGGGATTAKGGTLFERLGGMPAIKAVVEEFVNRTTTDPRIKHRFFNTDAENLKKLLAEFVCYATGGGCTYTGRDMATAHAGMDLVDEEFGALVENLSGALD